MLHWYRSLIDLISESVDNSDEDYHYHVHVYLQSMANKYRSTNIGAAIYYHKSVDPDQSIIEAYYEETIVPYLEKYNYPDAPEGPGDTGSKDFDKMVQQIINDWNEVKKDD